VQGHTVFLLLPAHPPSPPQSESSQNRGPSRVFRDLHVLSDEERQEVLQRGLLGRSPLCKSVESRGPCVRDPQEEGLCQHEEQGERGHLFQLGPLLTAIRGLRWLCWRYVGAECGVAPCAHSLARNLFSL